MANIDKEIILVRLRLINKYLKTLEEIRPVNFDEYSNDFRLQLMIERLLQLMTEAASDINIYLLVQLHQINPQTNFDSFIEAGKCGIITGELAAKLAPSTGLRNILVHQYKDIMMHSLKEEFRNLFDTSEDSGTGILGLLDWLKKAVRASAALAVPYYQKSVKTIKRWFREIAGYFERKTTNGVVEGINNKLKLIKRNGFGFRNFRNFEIRALLSWHYNINLAR